MDKKELILTGVETKLILKAKENIDLFNEKNDFARG